MEQTQAVTIVTIKQKSPLFKDGQPAERIELIELEENGFTLVSQKYLYQVGDKAVYIQPDYNLSDIPLFEGFLRPGGDVSKSMLGKVEGVPVRIRAKKFNFSREGNNNPVYSNGILLPYEEVRNYFRKTGLLLHHEPLEFRDLHLTQDLGITKYEEPEVKDKVGNKIGGTRRFPEGVYKTDETNINNLWGHIENKIGYPITLVGTEKVDGSSITIGVKNGKGFICSRNQQLDLIVKKHVGRREKTFLEKLLFWTKPNLNLYKEVENDSDFIKYGKPYLDIIIKDIRYDLILRGELNGSHLKGSGNKYNPASKEQPNIKFFGMDRINNLGIAEKVPYDDFIGHLTFLSASPARLGFIPVKEVFNKEFNSRQEIEQECENYFKENMIEGIVLRTLDSKFSGKYMSNRYDEKK
jgi:hypothetical protein